MALHVSAARLRDELTEVCISISAGRVVVVEGANRPAVVLRRLQSGDHAQRITMTQFRRQLHRVLREVRREPAIITSDGHLYFWVGPAPDDVVESADNRRGLLDR